MDGKSKMLLWAGLILLLISIGLTYYRFYVTKDFIIIEDSEEAEFVE